MHFKCKYLVYPTGKKCKLIVEPVFPQKLDENEKYSIAITAMSGIRRYGLRDRMIRPTEEDAAFFSGKQLHALYQENGRLVLNVTFPQEDCYICYLYVGDHKLDRMDIYALEEDLFDLNPYKGDNHLHTCYSDGREAPENMAAASCKLGYDYCLITDHRNYEPSLRAAAFFEAAGADFLVIPGEEVHSPDNPVHIINFGGKASVNAWWKEDDTEYRSAVAEEMNTIKEPMVEKDRYAAAASQVVFDKIRSVGGLSVLCHPHWVLPNGFNEAEDITDYLFDHKRFDVLELLAGGAYEKGTQLQLSYYRDKAAMPILGSSDAHGCFGGGLEPGFYTIVLAKDMTVESIKDAVKKGHTIAGDKNKLVGDYRLVKYGYFLQWS